MKHTDADIRTAYRNIKHQQQPLTLLLESKVDERHDIRGNPKQETRDQHYPNKDISSRGDPQRITVSTKYYVRNATGEAYP